MHLILTCIFMSAFTLSLHTSAEAGDRTVYFPGITVSPPDSSIAFSQIACIRKDNRVELTWNISHNELADRLIVQRSHNGKKFEMAGLVFGSDLVDVDQYRFYETFSGKKAYYRIIIVKKRQIGGLFTGSSHGRRKERKILTKLSRCPQNLFINQRGDPC